MTSSTILPAYSGSSRSIFLTPNSDRIEQLTTERDALRSVINEQEEREGHDEGPSGGTNCDQNAVERSAIEGLVRKLWGRNLGRYFESYVSSGRGAFSYLTIFSGLSEIVL